MLYSIKNTKMQKLLTSATKLCLLLVVLAIIALNFTKIPVDETLKVIAVAIVSFYFAQKNPSAEVTTA